MKYFPHLSNASDDEDIVDLLEVDGPEGYGVYWIITEIVARNLKTAQDVPSVTMLTATWARKCFISPRKLKKIVQHLSGLRKIVTTVDGDYLTVKHPKLLKYLDEYTKKVGTKSRHSPDNVPSVSGECPPRIEENRIEEKKRKKTTPPASAVEAAEPSSEIESPQARAEAMKTIRKAMAELPGPHPQQQAPKAQDSGNGKIPRAEGQEVEDMGVKLELEGFVDPAAQDILDAWWARKQGTHNEYALAAMLDKHNIKGQDRSKVYRCLGVV